MDISQAIVFSILFVIAAGSVVDSAGLECNGAQARMIGGPNACPVKAHSKPWIARMLRANTPFNMRNHRCGGTIVSKNLVLTANHCVDHRNPQAYLIAVGDHDIMKDDGEQTIEVAEILTPNEGIGYDIVLLLLMENINFNKNVKIAKLPKEGQNCPSGMNLTVSGWGWVDAVRQVPHRYLWAVKQKCLDVGKCTKFNGDPNSIICAGDPDAPSNSACHGDSGGPLTYTEGNETTILGVVHGPGLNGTEFDCNGVEVFGRVAEPNVLHWINKMIDQYQ